MFTKRALLTSAAATASSAALLSAPAQAQPRQLNSDSSGVAARLGPLTLDHGVPTPETRQKLYDDLDFQRALQAVLWAEPAVNNALFKRAMGAVGVRNLGAMLFDKRMQPGQEVLTPNQSVVYLYDNINLSETGPVVHVVPPGPINAGLFEMWMRPVYDFGIVGPNKGKGDRILIVPHGYVGTIPDGFQVARPETFQVFSITRVSVNERMSEEQGTELLRKSETYRLSEVSKPPAKDFVLMGDPTHGGKYIRMNRPAGLDYWKLVHEIIQEPVEDRDRILLGLTLAPIKIERGRAFSPDARMQAILTEAERVGHLMMINEAFLPRDIPAGITKEPYAGTQWEDIQIMRNMTQRGPNYDYATIRIIGFYQADGANFAWDPRDFPPGLGQKYAAVYKDRERNWLRGESSYHLRVPPKVPVADFWAIRLYDVQTRALVDAPQHVSEINPDVQKLKANADCSIDLLFGPTPPSGMEENWVQTVPGRGWFAYFRWYGPTEAFYNKSWSLPDIELRS